jgi:hypothetical protein
MYQTIKVEVLKQFLKPVEHRVDAKFKNQYIVSEHYEVYALDSEGLSNRITFIDEYTDGRIDLIYCGKIVDTIKQCNDWNTCITAMVLKVEKTIVEL